ncbi:MAG TPA: cupredoxin family copper-binding protein, partial [Chloroflexota bacterium]|nr:cupredoxin family copper-binding protein [Chloroflexota bacterium]
DGCARATPPSSAVLLALAISVAAGCVDSGSEERTRRISIRAFQYLPASDTVAVGDTVVWINQDAVPHTATAADRAWDTGSIATKQSGHVVVSKRGEHPYICALHPNMSGTLVVQ